MSTTKMTFEPNEKVTLIFANSASICFKEVVTIKGEDAKGWYGTTDKTKGNVYLKKDALIFRSDNIPYKIDQEVSPDSFFSGGISIFCEKQEDLPELRNWLKKNNINPHFTSWQDICYCTPNPESNDLDYDQLFEEE